MLMLRLFHWYHDPEHDEDVIGDWAFDREENAMRLVNVIINKYGMTKLDTLGNAWEFRTPLQGLTLELIPYDEVEWDEIDNIIENELPDLLWIPASTDCGMVKGTYLNLD